MVHIDSKFSGRVIVCGLDDDNIQGFTRSLLKHVWLEHNIPDGMRVVGSGTKLTLDMLPPKFDLEAVADKAVAKNILMLERIGAVNLWLNMFITRSEGTDPQIKVDIDKYKYEKDGDNLSSAVNKAIADLD